MSLWGNLREKVCSRQRRFVKLGKEGRENRAKKRLTKADNISLKQQQEN